MKSIVIVLMVLSLPVLSHAGETGSATTLVPPSEKIAGRSQADWSRLWWQWAESFADYESPIADKKGSRCQLKQAGAVWFLAGTYGTHRTIRTCTVPAGKYLYFPLINYVVYPRSGYSLPCKQATDTAAAMTEDVSSLVLEVDGKLFKNLETHRQPTKECFDLAALAGGGVTPSAANGYYIMLRPLSRGTHTLNFGGILPGMSQAVTYTLHVE
jgi:hypothetical protein